METERGTVRINLERGSTLSEFKNFLDDLEAAYLSIYQLPSERSWRSLRRRYPFPIDFLGIDIFGLGPSVSLERLSGNIYPPDQIEITKISIQSPGWIELLASLNPLEQIREYLKDRHERIADKEWRWDTEKHRAILELEVLQWQADKEKTGAIKEFYNLLDHMDITPEEKLRILHERVGGPLARLERDHN